MTAVIPDRTRAGDEARRRRLLASDDERIVVGEGVALDVRPAGFPLRAVSSIIDIAVLYLMLLGGLTAVGTTLDALDKAGAAPDQAMATAMFLGTIVAVLVGVPIAIETLTKGRSLGRWAMGLRIVRDDGGAAGFRHALVRGLLGVFELFMTFGGVAAIVGLLNPRAKRLGDMAAGTYCQHERVGKAPERAVPLPPQLQAWSRVADVAKLPDRTGRRILDYLDQAPKLDPESRRRMAESIGREALPYVHPRPYVDADTFLRGVAAMRTRRELEGLRGRAARRQRLAPALDRLPHGFPERG